MIHSNSKLNILNCLYDATFYSSLTLLIWQVFIEPLLCSRFRCEIYLREQNRWNSYPHCGGLKNAHQRCSLWSLGPVNMLLMWQKWLCRCDWGSRDGRLSRIIPVNPKCNYKCLYKREAEEDFPLEEEGAMWWCSEDGSSVCWRQKGPRAKKCGWLREGEKNSLPSEPSCPCIDFGPVKLISRSDLQNCGRANLCWDKPPVLW